MDKEVVHIHNGILLSQKRNIFESVLVKWMNPEPIIQCEVSQKEKDKYHIQFSSVTQSCPTLCDPIEHSTPGLPVHHQVPEFTQTHIHQVRDAIQPSHPLSSPSPPAPNSSQHQSLYKVYFSYFLYYTTGSISPRWKDIMLKYLLGPVIHGPATLGPETMRADRFH